MTREETLRWLNNLIEGRKDPRGDNEIDTALKEAVKIIEKEPCEVITEIPKDYLYDTETEDVLVYRHKYTGKEIHIEKPVKRYRIEPSEDLINRKELDKALYERFHEEDSPKNITVVFLGEVRNFIKNFPSAVNLPKPKTGHWVHGDLLFACYDTVDGESKFVRNIYAGNTCSLCGVKIGDFGTEEPYKFCPYCGYPMESEGD